MVKKETIGKIQLTLGIILLVGTIAWAAYSYNQINEERDIIKSVIGDDAITSKNYPTLSNETRLMFNLWRTNLIVEDRFSYEDQLASLQYSLIITMLLSLMIILQGLANIGDKK
jgi:hypothetical protein